MVRHTFCPFLDRRRYLLLDYCGALTAAGLIRAATPHDASLHAENISTPGESMLDYMESLETIEAITAEVAKVVIGQSPLIECY